MGDVFVKIDELKSLIANKLTEVNVSKEEAVIVSDVLVHADARGVRSHGSIRTEHYVNRIKQGGINISSKLEVSDTSASSALVDSKGGFGHVAMKFASDYAVKKVKENGGIYAITVQNSSHCGALSYYIEMALKEKFISMAFTNTDKCVVPFGGANAYFGTNPMAYGFPGNNHRILVDMATSEVALGKVIAAKEAGKEIPSTWGVDENGNPTTDPNKVVCVSPFGGYKGSALAIVVEGFTGFFTGAFGPYLTKMYGDLDKLRNISGTIIMMDSNIFGNKISYLESVDKIFDDLKHSKPAPNVDEIFVPGEIEDKNYQKAIEQGGVYVFDGILDYLNK